MGNPLDDVVRILQDGIATVVPNVPDEPDGETNGVTANLPKPPPGLGQSCRGVSWAMVPSEMLD